MNFTLHTPSMVIFGLLLSASAVAQTRTEAETYNPRAASANSDRSRDVIVDASTALADARRLISMADSARDGQTTFAGCTISDSLMRDELLAASEHLAEVQARLNAIPGRSASGQNVFMVVIRRGIRRAQQAIAEHVRRSTSSDHTLPTRPPGVTCTCYDGNGVQYGQQTCTNCSTSQKNAFIALCEQTSLILGIDGFGRCEVTYLPASP
jgi:hypothetical protein